jgi:type VI protein secretion system component Hcp
MDDGPIVEQQEVNMTDHVETLADLKAASVTSRELSEAELSMVAGGAGKVTFNPFSITRHVDKASPVLFL